MEPSRGCPGYLRFARVGSRETGGGPFLAGGSGSGGGEGGCRTPPIRVQALRAIRKATVGVGLRVAGQRSDALTRALARHSAPFPVTSRAADPAGELRLRFVVGGEVRDHEYGNWHQQECAQGGQAGTNQGSASQIASRSSGSLISHAPNSNTKLIRRMTRLRSTVADVYAVGCSDC